MKKIIILLFGIISPLLWRGAEGEVYAQDAHLIDSLTTKLKALQTEKTELRNNVTSINDSTIADYIYNLSKAYWSNNTEKAMDYANQCLSLSEQIGYKKGIANAYNSMGAVNDDKGDYLLSLEFYKKALKIYDEIDYKKGIAFSYHNTGVIYDEQGNYLVALKNYIAALKIMEDIGNKQGIANSYSSIGIIYKEQGNYAEAMKNQLASLKIREEIGNKDGIAGCFNSIGIIYEEQGKYIEAMKNELASIKINEEIGNKRDIAGSFNVIGNIYKEQGNYIEAMKNELVSLKIREEIGDKNGIAESYSYTGTIYTKEKNYTKASEYLNKALILSKEIGSLEFIKTSYSSLAELDSAQGNFKQYGEDLKLYYKYRDSISNNENTRKIVQMQMNFDFNKKQAEDSLKFAQEKEIGAIKLQKQKAITYAGFAGVAITIILLFFVYRNYNKQRMANKLLKETQEQLIKAEKMAAFGMVASRLSHEILNPLNFVNNFSILSKNLVKEINTFTNENEKQEATKMLTDNLDKINEHGKRAVSIVRQLQEMSNKGTAQQFFEEK